MLTLTVTDIKNYFYCPRTVYYHYFLPAASRPATFKMAEGKLEEARVEELEERRSLRTYGLTEGERIFNVFIASERLGINGLLDMVLLCPRQVIPVEFKNTTSAPGLNHKYQVTTYALLCEDKFKRTASCGFIYLIPQKRVAQIPVTPDTRRYAVQTMARIRAMLDEERVPPPTRHTGRCRDCEFRRWCMDRG